MDSTNTADRVDRAPFALRVDPDILSPTPHEYTRTGHAASNFGIPIARDRETLDDLVRNEQVPPMNSV